MMWTIATILNITSGFALMRYRGNPAEIIATSLVIDAALAPLTATIARRRGRSTLVWALLGFALGMWALAATLLIRARALPAASPPTSHAA
ncbi:MAG TPA: hypothetical protein VNE82_08555 [Candidatus Binataceae bacterium]|nr:hypothetical protein [Candidatus Binataceae bacterium]